MSADRAPPPPAAVVDSDSAPDAGDLPSSNSPFGPAEALRVVTRRQGALQLLMAFHKQHCWMETVQFSAKDVLESFPSPAARNSFTRECVILGLGAGSVVQNAPRGRRFIDACRQMVRRWCSWL
jgi:hypothetical protein